MMNKTLTDLTELITTVSAKHSRETELYLWCGHGENTWQFDDQGSRNCGPDEWDLDGYEVLKLSGNLHPQEIKAAIAVLENEEIQAGVGIEAYETDDLQTQYCKDCAELWENLELDFDNLLEALMLTAEFKEDGFWQCNRECAPMLLRVWIEWGVPHVVDVWPLLEKAKTDGAPGLTEFLAYMASHRVR
jgi:hypothetical protein